MGGEGKGGGGGEGGGGGVGGGEAATKKSGEQLAISWARTRPHNRTPSEETAAISWARTRPHYI